MAAKDESAFGTIADNKKLVVFKTLQERTYIIRIDLSAPIGFIKDLVSVVT